MNWEQAAVKKLAPKAESAPKRVATGVDAQKDVAKADKKAAVASAPSIALDVFDRAAESQKAVMLFIVMKDKSSALGKASLSMENLVFRNQKIFDAAQSLHAVKLGVKELPKALLKSLRVRTAPTVIFLDHRGKVITRVVGKSKPSKMLAIIKAVLKRNEKLKKAAGSAS